MNLTTLEGWDFRIIQPEFDHFEIVLHENSRGVFRTQPNIYDGAFLQKQLTAYNFKNS